MTITPEEAKDLVPVAQAAKEVGMSRNTFEKYAERLAIPRLARLGSKRVYVRRTDLDQMRGFRPVEELRELVAEK